MRPLVFMVGLVWIAGCATNSNSHRSAPVAASQPSSTAQGGSGVGGSAAQPVAPAGQSQSGLIPYTSPGGFTVMAPPNVTHSQQTRDTPQGPVEIHLTQASDPVKNINYLVSYSKFQQGALAKSNPRALLNSERDELVKSLNGQLLSSQEITISELPGMDFVVDVPASQRRVSARILQGKDEVYTLVTSYPPGAEPGDAQTFLKSFRLTNTPAS
jgi:hypothetical protein